MGTRTNEKKNRKVLIAVLLLLIAFAIIIGLAVSYFSDYVSTSVGATAGTLDIEIKSATLSASRYYSINGAADTEDPLTASNGTFTIANLNPGDVVKVSFDVENLGNKSAYLRNVVKLLANTTNYTPATTDDPTLAEIGGVFTLYPVTGNTPAGIRAGSGVNALSFTVGTGDDDEKLVIEPTTPTILSGKDGSTGEEDEGTSDTSTVAYYLYFNKTADNKFQNLTGISLSIVAQAMQYRNGATDNWSNLEQITLVTP